MIEQKQQVHDNVFDIEEPKKRGGKLWVTIALFVILIAVVFFIVRNPKVAVSGGIDQGDSVTLSYSVSLEDGTVVETVTSLRVVVGDSPVEGMDEVLKGMKDGGTATFSVDPQDGAGKSYDPGRVKKVPKVLFDNLGEEIETGKNYTLGDISGVAVGLEGEGSRAKVLLDTNPLETWQKVNYNITVISYVDDGEE